MCFIIIHINFVCKIFCARNFCVTISSFISNVCHIFAVHSITSKKKSCKKISSFHARRFANYSIQCFLFPATASCSVVNHLPEGKFDNADKTLTGDTISVPKTYTESERDFAWLDHLLRETPNSSIVLLEVMILFSNNKTSRWLNEKFQAEWSKVLQNVRACETEQ